VAYFLGDPVCCTCTWNTESRTMRGIEHCVTDVIQQSLYLQ